ncbi:MULTISPECIES: alpha/beta fold hydrolase [Dethiosulfovibrio]|uniref:Alpha/beta hydrolase n=2 Tax=Dethiosulfovibrio TaxID=47054 RepID=A0ABS9EMT3_9BACT|nr:MULTISPECIES: alpha/beta hydrolase [Dethiosulfovibrio]MCF4113370.1 alpha/beta hydrolase [Dethiosulfovibrio russensis]MCF4142493.1 alpha/beta hydrolase [Dethiosulfovibrio marinus]MCF4145889.1 alpha/beta hydrolase [Dethiosulfovibrio acidaminovorans]MEA3283947.1 alpha/beta hydrolase [Synergistota bacterium]
MALFNFEGKNIYYSELGSGVPLVLLHGNTASSKMFSGIAERYAEVFRVISIDFLGHGRSDRLDRLPPDLWFYEAQQTIAFLREAQLGRVNLIGSSGGALVAINVALEAPDLVNRVIADSFEGEEPLRSFIQNIVEERELSKRDPGARSFYLSMHGSDWEQVVDNDTRAIVEHEKEIGLFFHKDLGSLKPEILMTGSKKDEFVCAISPDYFEQSYGKMMSKIGHGDIFLFESGGHPAMLSNQEDFYRLSVDFFERKSPQ